MLVKKSVQSWLPGEKGLSASKHPPPVARLEGPFKQETEVKIACRPLQAGLWLPAIRVLTLSRRGDTGLAWPGLKGSSIFFSTESRRGCVYALG